MMKFFVYDLRSNWEGNLVATFELDEIRCSVKDVLGEMRKAGLPLPDEKDMTWVLHSQCDLLCDDGWALYRIEVK